MIVVLDYGMGNIHSIVKALKLFYGEVRYTNDPSEIRKARALVLPGDGHFETAMSNLKGEKQDLIYEHVSKQKALLGICIGFQVLFEDSSETIVNKNSIGEGSAPTLVKGLGILAGKIRRFNSTNQLRIPHMGWNQLKPTYMASSPAYFSQPMYFIHSYRPEQVDDSIVLTTTTYGNETFASTVSKNSVFACQYHPEKSDSAGLHFLKDWVKSI